MLAFNNTNITLRITLLHTWTTCMLKYTTYTSSDAQDMGALYKLHNRHSRLETQWRATRSPHRTRGHNGHIDTRTHRTLRTHRIQRTRGHNGHIGYNVNTPSTHGINYPEICILINRIVLINRGGYYCPFNVLVLHAPV